MRALCDAWNAAIGLKQPSLIELERAVGATERQQLFALNSGKLFLGQNLVAVTPIGTNPQDDAAAVIALQLVCASGYYGGPLAQRFQRLPRFELLGIRFPCSAQSLLDHVKRIPHGAALELQTSRDGWELYYGRALGFFFLPVVPGNREPSASSCYVIEYNYNLPYDGKTLPVIASW